MSKSFSKLSIATLIAAAALSCGTAQAQFFGQPAQQQQQYEAEETSDQATQTDPRFQRQIVSFQTREAPGTIVVDTANTYLYLVMGDGQALRYGIGVGREGFTWAGTQTVARKAEWPNWYPPAEMIARQPYLPRMTMGGPGNPLGARALYLGSSVYRIHGTNDPSTIGQNVSSGCIRLTNEDVTDLYERVKVGAKVIVLPQTTEARAPVQPRQQTVQQQSVSLTSSYAAPTRAQRTWASIVPGDLY
ncbi:MAG: L,D-transpeptidase [Pseudolabrys sp.]|nr:L,D-transpeptidase [Pseudolabrys sp.]